MDRIASFTINHDTLVPGFYISRKDQNIITYDLRTRRPNHGDYMTNAAMHSVEHMFATMIRNSEIKENVIYFGPMGCQTGFYLLVKDEEPVRVFAVTKKILQDILTYEGPVYGASARECGHYENLDLDTAKTECERYLQAIEKQTDLTFSYPD